MTKKHVVIITTWFAPINNVATNRMNAFAKYMDKEVFDVTVIAQHVKGSERKSELFGTTIFRESGSKLIRLRRQESYHNWFQHKLMSVNNVVISFFSKQDFFGWKKKVVARLEKVNKEKQIDSIISCYAPIDTHMAAYEFAMKNPSIKWIADMRDEMSQNPFNKPYRKKRLEGFETLFGKRIDAITTVSKPILDDFKTIFPSVKHFSEIRNGFDHEETPIVGFNEVFTIVYTGSVFGINKPTLFLTAMVEFKKRVSEFKIRFVGTTKTFLIPPELEENVEFVPKMPYKDAVREMIHADCNLLLLAPMGAMGRFSGKVFDYLSVEKPILALVDVTDVAADLIQEHNAGEVIDFFNVEAILSGILRIHNDWKNQIERKINKTLTPTLHRRYQVKKLEQLILEITEK